MASETLLNIGIQHDIGCESWWKELHSIGMPIIQRQETSQCLVTFIWQDPEGSEDASTTDSVLLDVNSLTDHHSWQPTRLNRVLGTDVWFGQLTVNSKWRGSYSFIPIKAHQNPDLVRRNLGDSIEAQRNWWLDVAVNQVADNLNPSPSIVSGWGTSSPLHMPQAAQELGWSEWEAGELQQVLSSEQHIIPWASSILGNQRECSVFSTGKAKAPLVILLDGQKWNSASGTLSVLNYLTDKGEIAPAHYLLIPSIDAKTRWRELSCYQPFWQAFLDELLPIVLKELNDDVSEYLVAGQSLGGLSSLYAALTFPETFSKVISLSGSFWWPEKSRMLSPKAEQESGSFSSLTLPENSLAELIQTGKVSVKHLEAFLTVGNGEKDMCLYNQMTYEAIQHQGGKASLDIVHGGHDWLSWRSSFMNGLMHLLPKK